MKHVKLFETKEPKSIKDDLIKILDQELYTFDNTIAYHGKECAVEEIIEYLKNLGINLDMYEDSRKFNL